MTRPFRPSPLTLALTLALAAGAAQAQQDPSGIADGTSNTIAATEGPAASLTTRASVSGSITQSSNQRGGGAGQVVSIGGARELRNGLLGSLTTDAAVNGNLTQTRSGFGVTTVGRQTLDVAGVVGDLRAQNVQARGVVSVDVTQDMRLQSSVAAGTAPPAQTVEVGTVRDAAGGSLQTSGSAVGGSLTQTSQIALDQRIAVGTITGGQLQSATTQGTVDATVVQAGTARAGTPGAAGSQRLLVGAIDGSQALSAQTQGTLRGALTQVQQGGLRQSVAIGSISGVDAAGQIEAGGAVAAGSSITQQGSGSNAVANLHEQTFQVGSVSGGAPTRATAAGFFQGQALQSMAGGEGTSVQRVAIGAVDNATGVVNAGGMVVGDLTQSMTDGISNFARRSQTVSVGSAERTAGTVEARGFLAGSVTQTAEFSPRAQLVSIGSVRDTSGTVRTDASVVGRITQAARGAQENQTVLIGGVLGGLN